MAEINIEQKTRSPLPWLVAGVVLVALLWFLFARNADEGVATMRGDSTYRDTSAAAGTLAQPADSAARLRDTTGAVPPR